MSLGAKKKRIILPDAVVIFTNYLCILAYVLNKSRMANILLEYVVKNTT
jgi:hypothetical protein